MSPEAPSAVCTPTATWYSGNMRPTSANQAGSWSTGTKIDEMNDSSTATSGSAALALSTSGTTVVAAMPALHSVAVPSATYTTISASASAETSTP